MRCTPDSIIAAFRTLLGELEGKVATSKISASPELGLMQRLCLERHIEDKFRGDTVDSAEQAGPRQDGKSGGEFFFGSSVPSVSIRVKKIGQRHHSVAKGKGVYCGTTVKLLMSCQTR